MNIVISHFLISLLILKGSISFGFEVNVPSVTQLAVYGEPIVLGCAFSVDLSWDLDNTVITWQMGLEVIHSFYHSTDQLDRQSLRYVNRTGLYHSEIGRGNASLLLKHANLEDRGEYTCSVSTLMGSQKKSFSMEVAAYYLEPHTSIQYSASGLELLLSSREGYPGAVVIWLDDRGQDFTNHSVNELSQADQGLYTLTSSVTLQDPTRTKLTFILRNSALRQEIRREFTLQSEGSVPESSLVTHERQRWIIVGVPILLLGIAIGGLALSCLLGRTRDKGYHHTNGSTPLNYFKPVAQNNSISNGKTRQDCDSLYKSG